MSMDGGYNLGNAYGRVILDASGVRRGVQEAQQAFRTGMQSISQQVGQVGRAMQGIGAGMTLATAPIAGFVAQGVQAFTSFNDVLTEIQARTGATEDVMAEIEATAIRMGQETAFSATQANDAMLQLLSSGYNLDQTFLALQPTLDLAAAGTLDLGYAADAVTDILAQFRLGAEDSVMVTNALAQASSSSSATIADLIDGYANVGPVAANYGMSVNETAAVLAVFAENGIKGAEAGTQLRSMLNNMARQTDDVRMLWQSLGVSMYDSQGNMRDLNAIIQDLNVAMADMSEEERNAAITTLAGTYGQMGLSALLAADGTEAMSAAMAEAATAQEVAAARMRSFRGVTNQLKSTLQTLSIVLIGPVVENSMIPFTRRMTEALNGVIAWARANPALAETMGRLLVKLSSLGAALIAVGTALLLTGPALAAIGAAVAAIVSPVGLVIGVVAALGAIWATNWWGIRDHTRSAIAAIMAQLGPLRTQLGDRFASVFEHLRDTVTHVYNALAPMFREIGIFLSNTLGRALSVVRDNIDRIDFGQVVHIGTVLLRMLTPLGWVLNILELIGVNLGDVFEGVTGAITRFFRTLNEGGGLGDAIRVALMGEGGDLSDLSERAGEGLRTFAAGVYERLRGIAGRIGAIAGDMWGRLIGRLRQIGPLVLMALQAFGRRALQWLGQNIPRMLATLLNALGALIGGIGPWLRENLPVLGDQIGDFLAMAIPRFVQFLGTVLNALVAWVTNDFIPGVGPAILNLVGVIGVFIVRDVIPGLIGFLYGLIRGVVEGILSSLGINIGALWDQHIGPFLAGIGAWISANVVTPVLNALNGIIGWFANLWTNISGHLSTAQSSLQTAFQWIDTNVIQPVIGAFEGIIAWFAGVWTSISPNMETLKTNLQTAFQWVDDHVVQPVLTALGGLVDWFVNAWASISPHVEAFKNSLSAAFATIRTTIIDPIVAAINAIPATFEHVKNEVQRIAGQIGQVIDNLNPFTGSGFLAGGGGGQQLPAPVTTTTAPPAVDFSGPTPTWGRDYGGAGDPFRTYRIGTRVSGDEAFIPGDQGEFYPNLRRNIAGIVGDVLAQAGGAGETVNVYVSGAMVADPATARANGGLLAEELMRRRRQMGG